MNAYDLSGTLARRVREIRERRGWSLDHLSKVASVSKGALVALENGSANPNLSTLCRLSETFGMPVSALLDYDATPEVRVGTAQRENALWTGPLGGWAAFVLAEAEPQVEVLQWHLVPGERYEALPYSTRASKVIAVTTGTLVLSLQSGDTMVPAGAKAAFSGTVSHSYSAAGTEPCDMNVVTIVA